MFRIVSREDYSDVTFMLEVEHPMMARAARPGQFVMVRLHEEGERIPLTIADFDPVRGTVTLVIQAVGKTTLQMQASCQPGTILAGMVGPMGKPSFLGRPGKIVGIGGGLGVAPIFPQLRAHKENGSYVVAVLGFRSKELMFWEDRFHRVTDELVICTDDGSAGLEARVTRGLEWVLEKHSDIDEVIAIGPPVMMAACADLTRPRGIPTVASLNPIMVDGTGMCGGCRVSVGGKTRFACVDGPDFDAHQVDFTELIRRLNRFKKDERRALERWKEHAASCNLLKDVSGKG